MEPDSRRIWNQMKRSLFYALVITIIIGTGCARQVDEATGIAYIRRAIDPIRFYPDSSGYFFVYNFDGVNIAHATIKELQGQRKPD
jgi:signal transduction histidine kinase